MPALARSGVLIISCIVTSYFAAVHKPYLVPPAQYQFGLLLQPLPATPGQMALAEAATAAWRAAQ